MKNYYFTYGSSDVYPFDGGHTLIKAENLIAAQKKHIKRYGYSSNGLLRYSHVYLEIEFKLMYPDGMNKGAGCHETIE